MSMMPDPNDKQGSSNAPRNQGGFRIVRVKHARCDEWDGDTTIALAPAEWTDAEVSARVKDAQADYLAAYRDAADARENAPKFPGYHPNYEAHPDKLVRDVLSEHAAAKAAYDEHQAKSAHTRQRFEWFLDKRGFVTAWSVDAAEHIVDIRCDWGHRHGMRLNYGDPPDRFPTAVRLVAVDSGDEEWDDDDFA
jgi:hypothetical protein